jgi:hypothetical protein
MKRIIGEINIKLKNNPLFNSVIPKNHNPPSAGKKGDWEYQKFVNTLFKRPSDYPTVFFDA